MRKAFETLGLAPKWQQPRRSRGEEATADGTPGRHELTRLRSGGWRTRRAGPGPSAPPASGVLCPPRAAELNGPCLARAPCLALSIPRCVNPGREARERRAASAGSACPGDEAHTHVHRRKVKPAQLGRLSLSPCAAPAADLRLPPQTSTGRPRESSRGTLETAASRAKRETGSPFGRHRKREPRRTANLQTGPGVLRGTFPGVLPSAPPPPGAGSRLSHSPLLSAPGTVEAQKRFTQRTEK